MKVVPNKESEKIMRKNNGYHDNLMTSSQSTTVKTYLTLKSCLFWTKDIFCSGGE